MVKQGALRVTVVQGAGAVVIRPDGEADLASVHVLETALRDAVAAGAARVVVDCTALSYLDSSGIRCLVNAATAAEAHGGRIVVSGVSPIVRRVLEITKVDHLLCDDGAEQDGRREAD